MNRPSASASRSDTVLRSAAKGLGVFSIALGVTELVAPRTLARFTGVHGREGLVRAYGLREIVNGIGLLTSNDPRPWLWGRVAGDALDLATLASGSRGARSNGAASALWMAAAIGVLDVACALLPDQKGTGAAIDYSDRVGLAGPPEQMRGAARDFEVPRDMRPPEALRAYASP
jgi:hypothetical protein